MYIQTYILNEMTIYADGFMVSDWVFRHGGMANWVYRVEGK